MKENRFFSQVNSQQIGTFHQVLKDGRKLAYSRFGLSGGFPVYYFHGCPGSRFEAAASQEAASTMGFEVFAIERPGCGQSDPAKNYEVLNWVKDVEAFADLNGHNRFGIVSFSGGGTYACACAYAIPDRLAFVYDLGGWGPVGQVDELTDHLAPLDRFFLRRADSFGFIFRIPFSFIGLASKWLSDRSFVNLLKSSMSKDDQEFLHNDANLAHFFRSLVKESFSQGVNGPADDAIRCYRPWGFDLQHIRFPMQIWHGTDDKFAHYEIAKYKHQMIKVSALLSFEGRGHLHMLTLFDQIFKEARNWK